MIYNYCFFFFRQALLDIVSKFQVRHNMPRTVGCIDGTHIKIKAPNEQEWAFVNRKGHHSVNVQVCIVIFIVYKVIQFTNTPCINNSRVQ